MKGTHVGAEFGHQAVYSLRHQPGYEVDVAAQPVKLGNQHGAAEASRGGQRRGELRPTVQGIGPLPRLHLGERLGHLQAVLRGKDAAPLPLGIQS